MHWTDGILEINSIHCLKRKYQLNGEGNINNKKFNCFKR